MVRVFLSSTYVDLQPERDAVRDALLRLQYQYSGMEYFGSDPEKPLRLSLSRLEGCNVYVGIIAHRYGNIDVDTDKSITRLEYECAKARAMPTFIYEKSESCAVQPTSKFIDFRPQDREKLREFKELLRRDNVVQTFTSADDLAAKVTADLARLALAQPRDIVRPRLVRLTPSAWFIEDEKRWFGNTDEPAFVAANSAVPLLGPKGVGKTVYGCTLVHQPIAYPAAHGIAVELNGDVGYLSSCYRRLVDGEWLSPTLRTDRRYAEIIIRKKRFLRYREYRLHLLDIPGEQWYGDPDYHDGFHRLYNDVPDLATCAGLILLFEVVDLASSDPFSARELDPEYANYVGFLAHASEGDQFTKPVAIVLTKCDRLPEVLGNSRRAVNYVRSTYPLAFAQICARLKTFQIFPISSVGSVDAAGNPATIRPVGIWGPITWLAAQR